MSFPFEDSGLTKWDSDSSFNPPPMKNSYFWDTNLNEMAALQLKAELHNLIDQVNDSSVLKAIQTLLQKQVEKDEVGFDAKGKPLSLKAFIKRIEKAEADVKAGKYVTIEELDKESQKW